MTLVVVGHRPGAALLHWQAGLGAVERLDLALFIDREDDGMGGRINIETDDVAQLVDEARGGEEFELFHPVRLQAMRAPDSGARLIVQEALVTCLHEAFLPAPHTGFRLAGPAHDFIGANTVRAQQDYLSPPDMLVRAVAVPRQRLQTAAVGRLKSDGNSCSP